MIAAILVLLALVQTVYCRSGVDLSVATTVEDWQCLAGLNVTFANIRVYRSLGEVDTNSPASILNAHKAGISNLGAYIFPCVQSSSYVVSKGITCPSAEEQIASTLEMLHAQKIFFEGEHPAPRNAVKLNRMWLDIEDEVPAKYYDADPEVNKPFVQSIVDRLTARNIPVGVYTTKTYWQNIMANVEGYGQYPLWYPRYDAVDSMDFFAPFADWTECAIKQTAGDSGQCKLTQVDSDFAL